MNARTVPREKGHRMMRIAEDSEAVFAEAIDCGVLSEDAGDDNFAGHYMYMFHDADGSAWLKHHDTRRYLTVGLAACDGAAAGNGPDEREAGQP